MRGERIGPWRQYGWETIGACLGIKVLWISVVNESGTDGKEHWKRKVVGAILSLVNAKSL